MIERVTVSVASLAAHHENNLSFIKLFAAEALHALYEPVMKSHWLKAVRKILSTAASVHRAEPEHHTVSPPASNASPLN